MVGELSDPPGTVGQGASTTGHSIYLDAILAACPSGTAIGRPDDLSEGWIHVRGRHPIPRQGWKLHLSASLPNAGEVLARVVPVLAAEAVSFKVAASPFMLSRLNQGYAGLSQVGKFITVYPADDDQAVRLARTLHTATDGLRGPAIPSDRPLAPGSLVHYRYGGFQARHMQTLTGEIVETVSGPGGDLIPDPRLPRYTPPEWAVDPFLAGGAAAPLHDAGLVLGGRYLVAATLSLSARGAVHLAADLRAGRRCVLKRTRSTTTRAAGPPDPAARLRHEAAVLQRLAPNPCFPAVYELFEEGDSLLLALEDVAGRSLEATVREYLRKGCVPPIASSLRWMADLARALAAVHATGFVYRDVKSTNVLLAPDGRIRLIDFELAHEMGTADPPHGLGTPGYMSPQQMAEEAPVAADDVYGLGALLTFLLTGAEPSHAPDITDLLSRPVERLNPAIGPALTALVARCLHPDPACRFPSMDSLAAHLDSVGTAGAVAGVTVPAPTGGWKRGERFRDQARSLGDALCDDARPAHPLPGVRWESRHPSGAGLPYRSLNLGSGGALLALAEIAGEFGDERHREGVRAGARYLIAAPPADGPRSPGLYAGEAGIAAALQRAGQILGAPDLVAAATDRAELVAALPHLSPDLFNGTAGRLRLHLLLWDETGDAVQLKAAIGAGDHLLRTAVAAEHDGLCWTFPEEVPKMAGHRFVGYAHGAAGIADALLDLHDATGDPRYLEAASRAGRWVAGQAIPSLDDGSGVDWPAVPGETFGDGTWCHGAAGIGRFLLHAAALDAVPGALDLAARAGRTVARGMRWTGPVLCHGLAGHIDLLLDLFAATGDRTFLLDAEEVAGVLDAFAVKRNGSLRWYADMPRTISPDYLVGYAGIAVTLLRLASPGEMPAQLSRAGFRRRPRCSTSTTPAGVFACA